MGARVPLGKALNATSGPASNGYSASQLVRLADPPYLFDSPITDVNGVTWTGSVVIQSTMDSMPLPNNGGGVTNGGVTDANARWEDILTLAAGGGQQQWTNPLYRIRAKSTGVTLGSPDVYRLEGIRTLSKTNNRGTQRQRSSQN